MALYLRLLGQESPKIPVHGFQACLAEHARGKLTNAEAQAVIEALSGAPLSAAEAADAMAISALVTAIPVSGSATAQADGRARRAMKQLEIDAVFLLADARAPGYTTEAQLRAKLGT